MEGSGGVRVVTADPRIHFALNCGARGCPPIRFYRGEDLDAMLSTATRAFCKSIEVGSALERRKGRKEGEWSRKP
eukprot:755503-Hanusia_phi.AAC.7